MPTFDLLVVGAGGGPSEANLSGCVCNAASWRKKIPCFADGRKLIGICSRLTTSLGRMVLSLSKLASTFSLYLLELYLFIILAGSGLGALKRILEENPGLLSETPGGKPGPTATQLHSYIRFVLPFS